MLRNEREKRILLSFPTGTAEWNLPDSPEPGLITMSKVLTEIGRKSWGEIPKLLLAHVYCTPWAEQAKQSHFHHMIPGVTEKKKVNQIKSLTNLT